MCFFSHPTSINTCSRYWAWRAATTMLKSKARLSDAQGGAYSSLQHQGVTNFSYPDWFCQSSMWAGCVFCLPFHLWKEYTYGQIPGFPWCCVWRWNCMFCKGSSLGEHSPHLGLYFFKTGCVGLHVNTLFSLLKQLSFCAWLVSTFFIFIFI